MLTVGMHLVKCDRLSLKPAYGADDGWGAADVG